MDTAGRADEDTLRPEYSFRNARRGATAARYAEGANVVVVAPDLLDVFPDSASVDDALRSLAPLLRRHRSGGVMAVSDKATG